MVPVRITCTRSAELARTGSRRRRGCDATRTHKQEEIWCALHYLKKFRHRQIKPALQKLEKQPNIDKAPWKGLLDMILRP